MTTASTIQTSIRTICLHAMCTRLKISFSLEENSSVYSLAYNERPSRLIVKIVSCRFLRKESIIYGNENDDFRVASLLTDNQKGINDDFAHSLNYILRNR